MITKYDVHDVFTPTKPARLTFVERDALNTRLVNALRTPGKQIVVYGHSGSGKTTLLLNKLHQTYENHLTSRCMSGITFEQLILDAFDQLSPYYKSESSQTDRTQISARLSNDYLSIKYYIDRQVASDVQNRSLRILPPQLTAQALARFMGEARCCWVLEDFHKIDNSEKSKLSQIMKVFMDSSDDYSTLKIIAIGATDTARQVVEYDSEMRNRVAEIYVPLMSDEEIIKIIEKGFGLLGIEIPEKLITSIAAFANGIASVCHHLCLNLCTCQGINETLDGLIRLTEDDLNGALDIYLEEVSDTLKKTFDTAFKQSKVKKFDNAKLIVRSLTRFPQEGALRSEIYQKVCELEPGYPQGNLTQFLEKLSGESDGSLLRLDKASGRYSFKDPFFRAFALVYFEQKRPKTKRLPTIQLESLEVSQDLMRQRLTEAIEIYLRVRDNP